MITTFLALGAGAAMQAAQAGELPDGIQEFAVEEQQTILLQGRMAHERIRREVRKDLEPDRVAFIESQLRGIEAQGERALASIKEDLELRAPEGMAAGTRPRDRRRPFAFMKP